MYFKYNILETGIACATYKDRYLLAIYALSLLKKRNLVSVCMRNWFSKVTSVARGHFQLSHMEHYVY